MDSVGVFCAGEIDGKPFLIFNLLSKTSSSSPSPSCSFSGDGDTDLSGDHLSLESLQPRFLCPYSRFKKDNNLYCFDIDYIKIKICEDPVLPLFWCNNEVGFRCGGCAQYDHSTAYYICLGCKRIFHKECVESPLQIQNPSFPFLSFHLDQTLYNTLSCIRCETEIYGLFYRCRKKNFKMHPLCAMKPIPTLIENPKRHHHSLAFFPKQASLLCDICGLVEEEYPTYVCTRCIFVVHQDCIYLPFVIKISRHPHRISFTSSRPSGKWFCGVCRQKVDNRFGAYSCIKCSDYFVHSKCALREDVWDGKELEGVPEEPEEVVDPFETIADGIIRHFTHVHHLKLEVSKVYDEYTICQACILPIYEGNYYSCLDGCNFVLHETCASAPRKIHHPLHAHPLMLNANCGQTLCLKGYFCCDACQRNSCGFVYKVGNYMLDVRCASVSEPFKYQGHEHPLYLSLDPTEEREATCRICRQTNEDSRKLSCIECDYVICFRCATLPYMAKYKHDSHFKKGKREVIYSTGVRCVKRK